MKSQQWRFKKNSICLVQSNQEICKVLLTSTPSLPRPATASVPQIFPFSSLSTSLSYYVFGPFPSRVASFIWSSLCCSVSTVTVFIRFQTVSLTPTTMTQCTGTSRCVCVSHCVALLCTLCTRAACILQSCFLIFACDLIQVLFVPAACLFVSSCLSCLSSGSAFAALVVLFQKSEIYLQFLWVLGLSYFEQE